MENSASGGGKKEMSKEKGWETKEGKGGDTCRREEEEEVEWDWISDPEQ